MLCVVDGMAVFRARSARFPEGRGQPQAPGRQAAAHPLGIGDVSAPGRAGGKAFVNFGFEVSSLDLVQGEGARRTVRPDAGLQAGPEEGREHNVEMEVQPGLRPRPAVLETQVLPGIAESKPDLEAGPVEVEEAGRVQLAVTAVEEHAPGRLRVGPAGQDIHHPRPAMPDLAVQRAVVQVNLLVVQDGAGQACRVAGVEATVELLAAARRRRPTVCRPGARTPSTKVRRNRRPRPPGAPPAAPRPRPPGTAGRRGDGRRPRPRPRPPAASPPITSARPVPCRSKTRPRPRSCVRSWTGSRHPGPAASPTLSAPADGPPPACPRPGARRGTNAQTSTHGCGPPVHRRPRGR